MCRRYMPLEAWEWAAISAHRQLFDPAMLYVSVALLEAERLVRRGPRTQYDSFNKSGVEANDEGGEINFVSPVGAPRIEHRLYTLFAE